MRTGAPGDFKEIRTGSVSTGASTPENSYLASGRIDERLDEICQSGC